MGWINKIGNIINNATKTIRPPVTPIPPILLLCEIMDRPGLSAISLTSSIISRLPEIGLPTDVNPDGTENKISQYTRIIVEELIKEIQTNAVINCAITPGSINIVGIGTVAGIPSVNVTASNVNPVKVDGIMR